MKQLLLAAGMAVILNACQSGTKEATGSVDNPFFQEYATPFGVPPFDKSSSNITSLLTFRLSKNTTRKSRLSSRTKRLPLLKTRLSLWTTADSCCRKCHRLSQTSPASTLLLKSKNWNRKSILFYPNIAITST